MIICYYIKVDWLFQDAFNLKNRKLTKVNEGMPMMGIFSVTMDFTPMDPTISSSKTTKWTQEPNKEKHVCVCEREREGELQTRLFENVIGCYINPVMQFDSSYSHISLAIMCFITPWTPVAFNDKLLLHYITKFTEWAESSNCSIHSTRKKWRKQINILSPIFHHLRSEPNTSYCAYLGCVSHFSLKPK